LGLKFLFKVKLVSTDADSAVVTVSDTILVSPIAFNDLDFVFCKAIKLIHQPVNLLICGLDLPLE
jgi:hypothetical protein